MDTVCYMALPHELDASEIGYYYKAIETDVHSGGAEFVSRCIQDGLMELWVYNDGDTILVTITRLETYPDGFRELLVQMMAGTNVTSTDAHLDCERAMMKYATKNGAQRMVAYMRPNIWDHMKGPLGDRYKPEYVVLSLAPEAIRSAPDDGVSREDLPGNQYQTHSDTPRTEGND